MALVSQGQKTWDARQAGNKDFEMDLTRSEAEDRAGIEALMNNLVRIIKERGPEGYESFEFFVAKLYLRQIMLKYECARAMFAYPLDPDESH
jgi:hypothetical protein